MNAFIIDDENSSRNTLKIMLQKFCPQIVIQGESSDFTEAIIEIGKSNPSILFLDINLGGNKTGFDLLNKLKDYRGNVIMITAHQDFALKAFNYANIIHYLLKPIDPLELIEAITRIQNKAESKPKQEEDERKISLPFKKGFENIPIDDIIFLEGDGSYCKIHLANEKVLVMSKNLKHMMEKLLDYPEFIKTHKSFIVNKHHISMYLRSNGGQLELSNKKIIPISLTHKKRILGLFQ